MTFLALTWPQTVLLGIVTAGAIVALYFLKLRHRRVFVSSSLLWGRVIDDQQANSLMEKLRRIISIILAVTIALLIALGLARPQIEALTGKNQRIVIVMDTSPTMLTLTSDGKTRWQHAVEKAIDLLSGGGPTTEFRVSDTSRSIASSFTTDRKEIRQTIEGMKPIVADPDFPKVETADSLVYFISDGVLISQAPSGVQQISVFEKARNAGITAFAIRPAVARPGGYDAYLEVQNLGTESTEASIVLSGTGGHGVNKTVTLAVNESYQEIFDLSDFEGGGIRVAVQSKGDDLAADDVAFAYLPVKRQTKTLLVTRGNSYLQSVLKFDPFVSLSIVDPAAFHETPDVDAYIFDRWAPPNPPSHPALIIGVPAAPWLRAEQGVVHKLEIASWVEDHPVMQYVSIHDLSIERAARIDATDLTVIAAGSDKTPLIVASEKPKWVMLTFDLDASNFPLQLSFPIFIDNVLSWFSRDRIALRSSPGSVEVPLANAQIRTIDGKTIASTQELNKTVFEADEPGLYTATQGDMRLHVAVNLANRTYSDVNHSTFRKEGAATAQTRLLPRELWFYMIFAAVILMAAEWYTYHKRITL